MSLLVGLSQITYLSDAIACLHDLHTMPVSIIVMLQSTIIPAAAISMVSVVVPRTLQHLATLRGFVSQRQMEESIQKSYFAFLVTQIFLVASVSVSIQAALVSIKNAGQSIPMLLTKTLPNTSNYFLSYIIISIILTISSLFLRINTLIFFVSSLIAKRTPRKQSLIEEDLNLKQ